MRYVLLAAAAVAIVGLLTGDRRMWRFFYVVLGLALAYTALKLTGALDALSPERSGVF